MLLNISLLSSSIPKRVIADERQIIEADYNPVYLDSIYERNLDDDLVYSYHYAKRIIRWGNHHYAYDLFDLIIELTLLEPERIDESTLRSTYFHRSQSGYRVAMREDTTPSEKLFLLREAQLTIEELLRTESNQGVEFSIRRGGIIEKIEEEIRGLCEELVCVDNIQPPYLGA